MKSTLCYLLCVLVTCELVADTNTGPVRLEPPVELEKRDAAAGAPRLFFSPTFFLSGLGSFSSDVRLFAAPAMDFFTYVWDVESGLPILKVAGRSASFCGPDVLGIINDSGDPQERQYSVEFWSVRSQKRLVSQMLEYRSRGKLGLSCSPSGRFAVFEPARLEGDDIIQLFDVDGKRLAEWRGAFRGVVGLTADGDVAVLTGRKDSAGRVADGGLLLKYPHESISVDRDVLDASIRGSTLFWSRLTQGEYLEIWSAEWDQPQRKSLLLTLKTRPEFWKPLEGEGSILACYAREEERPCEILGVSGERIETTIPAAGGWGQPVVDQTGSLVVVGAQPFKSNREALLFDSKGRAAGALRLRPSAGGLVSMSVVEPDVLLAREIIGRRGDLGTYAIDLKQGRIDFNRRPRCFEQCGENPDEVGVSYSTDHRQVGQPDSSWFASTKRFHGRFEVTSLVDVFDLSAAREFVVRDLRTGKTFDLLSLRPREYGFDFWLRGNAILVMSDTGCMRVVDVESGSERPCIDLRAEFATDPAQSRMTSERLASLGSQFQLQSYYEIDVAEDADLAVVRGRDSAVVVDLKDGRIVSRRPVSVAHYNNLTGPARFVDRIGELVYLRDQNEFWNVRSGEVAKAPFSDWRHDVVGNHRWIATTGGATDNTLFIHGADLQERFRVVLLGAGDWLIVDSAGRFDSSSGASVDGLHWMVGTEPIAFEQLKDRYYEPGLLSKLVGASAYPLSDVDAFDSVDLFPAVSLTRPDGDRNDLLVDLRNRGGGIGRVRVLVNGKEIAGDARGPKPDPDAESTTLTVDLSGAPIIPGEENEIEVIAWNKEGYLSSRGVRVKWTPTATKPPEFEQPRLFAIVGGVSDYSGEAIDLRYAGKDAVDFADALRLGAKRLFGVDKVDLRLLTTQPAPGAVAPSKANFRAAFEEIATQARPTDVFVVYLAGHGTAVRGESDLYYYLTREARSTDLTDPAIRQTTAISSEELTEWIKKVPALKQVMILDTCAAGAAADKLVETRALPSDQIRAIERLKDRTGFHILMGSASDAVSYEATQYGQGLLTWSLLQGMKGAALREGEYVDVSKLFQHAADQVPQLARNIGGIQRPVIAAPRGTSFDVGRLTETDRRQIPLAEVLPQVLPPVFLNAVTMIDSLRLGTLVAKRLAEASGAGGRGKRSLVFVPADDLPGAIRPSGTYSVNDGKVSLTLVLSVDGEIVRQSTVFGRSSEPDSFVESVVAEISHGLVSGD